MRAVSVTMVKFETDPDSWRVNLPTYNMVEADYANGRAIVTVPDADFPATSLTEGGEGFAPIGEFNVLTSQSPEELAAWKNVLNRRYRWPLSRLDVAVTEWLAGS